MKAHSQNILEEVNRHCYSFRFIQGSASKFDIFFLQMFAHISHPKMKNLDFVNSYSALIDLIKGKYYKESYCIIWLMLLVARNLEYEHF